MMIIKKKINTGYIMAIQKIQYLLKTACNKETEISFINRTY